MRRREGETRAQFLERAEYDEGLVEQYPVLQQRRHAAEELFDSQTPEPASDEAEATPHTDDAAQPTDRRRTPTATRVSREEELTPPRAGADQTPAEGADATTDADGGAASEAGADDAPGKEGSGVEQ